MRALIWVSGVLALMTALVMAVVWFLSPGRLTPLLNRELSEYLNADVKAVNVQFSLWPSFPRMKVEVDSLRITSRALDSLPRNVEQQLPADARTLLTSGRITGSINLRYLMAGDIMLGDVTVDSLNVNMVQATDSVANWDIFPATGENKIPRFAFGSITLTHPRAIRFRSVPDTTQCIVSLQQVKARQTGDDKYAVALSGLLSATKGDAQLLESFPFNINAPINLGFEPFAIGTEDSKIVLGNIHSCLTADIDIDDQTTVRRLLLKIKEFNVNEFLSLLPRGSYSSITGLDADMAVGISANITTPYVIGEEQRYPDCRVDVTIPYGNVRYTDRKGKTYRADGLTLAGRANIDGKHPERSDIDVEHLAVSDGSTALRLSGHVAGPWDNPTVEARIHGKASLAQLAAMFMPEAAPHVSGKIVTDMRLGMRIDELRHGNLANVRIEGSADISGAHIRNVGKAGEISADNLGVKFHARSENMTPAVASGSLFDFDVKADGLHVHSGDYDIHGDDIVLTSRGSTRDSVLLANLAASMPCDLTFKAAVLHMSRRTDTLRLLIKDAAVRGNLTAGISRKVKARKFNFKLSGSRLAYRRGRTSASLNDVNATLAGEHLGTPKRDKDFPVVDEWISDMASAPGVRTTPRVLHFDMPQSLRDMMSRWNMGMHITGSGGTLLTPAYPVVNHLTGVNVEASFDSIVVHRMAMRSQKSAGSVEGSVSNVRQFLLSRNPAPLRLRFFADFDTIQFNQLAGAYKHGVNLTKGQGAFERMLHNTAMTAADSTAMLIPRNLDVRMGLKIDQVQYTDIHYNDCRGTLNIMNGDLGLEDVTVNTNFVDFAGSLHYDTHNLQTMQSALRLDMDNLDVERFFYYFHTLSLMVPQLTNLTGTLDIGTAFDMRIYPTMYAMLPSMSGHINLHGEDIRLKQTPFIRHLTRMMMLTKGSPLQIDTVNVSASIFDNLIMVRPFTLLFDNYKLRIGGLNNLNGDMFYHIGLKKWPIDIPFGINLKGNFSHPEIHLGGAGWHDRYATTLANEVTARKQTNILYTMKHIVLEFIEKAAEADTSPASDYLNFKTQ